MVSGCSVYQSGSELADSCSVFSITPDELKTILKSKQVVSSPITSMGGGQYIRPVDTWHIVGKTALKFGGKILLG